MVGYGFISSHSSNNDLQVVLKSESDTLKYTLEIPTLSFYIDSKNWLAITNKTD